MKDPAFAVSNKCSTGSQLNLDFSKLGPKRAKIGNKKSSKKLITFS